jgi:hypothetical protein
MGNGGSGARLAPAMQVILSSRQVQFNGRGHVRLAAGPEETGKESKPAHRSSQTLRTPVEAALTAGLLLPAVPTRLRLSRPAKLVRCR